MDGSVFRLFVSSTFADFEAEREILQRVVFPRLREQAMAGGARFVPVDLRWGISREAADQQETMEICLREVDRCNSEGQPPRLLALVGHRRGWMPLPRSVPVSVWERGEPAVTATGLERLKRAYRRDENARPASWVLSSGVDGESLREDVAALIGTGCADSRTRRSLLGSATEQELLRAFTFGRRQRPNGLDAVILVRELPSLPTKIKADQEKSAKNFLEFRREAGECRPDDDGHKVMAGLAEELADGGGAPWARLRRYEAAWDDAQAKVQLTGRQRQDFADLAFDLLSQMMTVTLQLDRGNQAGSREERSHSAILNRHLTSFAGRERQLAHLRRLIPDVVPDVAASAPPRPVVIVSGPTGSGKSALMAKAAERAGKDRTVIARFAGATRMSASAGGLCRSINLELARHLEISSAHARRDDLFAVADLLALAARQGRGFHSRSTLAVFIDAVDLITSDAGRAGGRPASGFRWLPPAMPPQVTLVLSAHEDNARALAECFHACEPVQLGPLSPEDASAMLSKILWPAGRDLTAEQRDALLAREREGWLPLSLEVAAQDALGWPSWIAEREPRVSTTFSDVIGKRLSDLRRHGRVLVASALGYLLAARDGLAEDELRELLAQDERVIEDLTERFPYFPLPVEGGAAPRVPDVVLSRLLFDLSPYLIEYPVDGQALMRLAHGEFNRAARRHVARTDGRPAADWHRRVAGYFRDQWPLNRRALAELPYQLAKAHLWAELTSVVSEFPYLHALVTGDAQIGQRRAERPADAGWSAVPVLLDLLAMAQRAARKEPAARQTAAVLRVLSHAIAREQRYLARWPEACWQQLANRLLADPGGPAVLRESFKRESVRSPRAWLEMLPGGFGPDALAAAYRTTDGNPPGAVGVPIMVQAMAAARTRGALIVVDSDGGLASWDPAAPATPTVFRPRGASSLTALAPLGDGRVLACDGEGVLELWDVPRQREQREPVGSLGRGVKAMAYFPEERCLVTATGDVTRCWDFDGSALVGRLGDAPRWVHRPGATRLYRLPRGRVLAVGAGRQARRTQSGHGAGHEWEAACLSVADHSELWRHPLPAEVRATAVDHARAVVALGDTNHRVTLRDLETGTLAGFELDVGGTPTALAFAPSDPGEDATLLVGRADGWLARYPAPGRGEGDLLPAHGRAVDAIAVLPQLAQVITGGADGWVRSWDLGAREWRECAAARRVRAAVFEATGRWALACCGDTGTYRVGAADRQWVALAGVAAAPDPVLEPLPAGLGVVVSLRDGSLGWVRADGETLSVMPLSPAVTKVTALAATADGAHVFAADSDGGLSVVPLADTGAAAGPRATVRGYPITSLACLPDGSGALAGDGNGLITKWTAGDQGGLSPGRPRRIAGSGITALAAVPGRGAVIAGTRAGDVVLMGGGQPGGPVRLGRHDAAVTHVAVGLGGRVAITVSGGDEPAICVWDLAESRQEGQPVTRLPLPDEPVAVGFRPGQPELAILGRPGRIRRMRLHLTGAWRPEGGLTDNGL